MTYTTTHLGVSTLLLYSLIPRTRKKYLRENPKIFFLLSLGSIFPDLDLFIGGHRYASHSILTPILFTLIVSLIRFKNTDTRFNLQFFGMMWFTHMIFDLTFGPMALFWPIDNRFYDANMGVAFNLEGNAFLPITIKGLFIQLIASDPSTGSTVYFVNWSAEERIAYFGSNILLWPIENFNTQAVIFLWYIYFVVKPMISYLIKNKMKDRDIGPENKLVLVKSRILNIYNSRNDWFTISLLITLIVLSIFAGPRYGKTWIDTEDGEEALWSLSETHNVITLKTYQVPSYSNFTLNASIPSSEVAFDIFVVEIEIDRAETIISDVNTINNKLKDGNITQLEFFNQYTVYIADKISDTQEVNENSSAQWSFSADNNITLLIGLYSWDFDASFIKRVKLQAEWEIERLSQFYAGIYSAMFFSALLVTILIKKRELT